MSWVTGLPGEMTVTLVNPDTGLEVIVELRRPSAEPRTFVVQGFRPG